MKVRVYVDGFNLYHRALKKPRAADGVSTYKWLNLEALADAMLGPPYVVEKIRYFTARVKPLSFDPDAPARQGQYLRALRTLSRVSIHYGFFRKDKKWMHLVTPLADGTAKVKVHKIEEKGSDVNLGAYLLLDAFQGLYDAAAVITNDSDLAEPIRIVRDVLGKPVQVLDPSGETKQRELKQVCTFYKPIRLGAIVASQFADPLTDGNGSFSKPATW